MLTALPEPITQHSVPVHPDECTREFCIYLPFVCFEHDGRMPGRIVSMLTLGSEIGAR